ncbi:hypothetical protein GEM_5820 [Burkholderia cepacia GG4]|uniref:Uncharacterized protein n=1 Tax=Burkholderia cepacia GG4 TaxID=1009846 RepID=A0A9W3K877_BURCE|nr:hypothetical protein GEM_5820 [Burkholderia cepacia GG4]
MSGKQPVEELGDTLLSLWADLALFKVDVQKLVPAEAVDLVPNQTQSAARIAA